MADLAKYVVALEAETAKYERKLDQANRKLDSFERNQRKKLDLIKKGVIALASAFSLRAVTNFGREQIELADNLLKTTQRIGGTVEALSELEHVADISGLRFETMTMGLQRMTRRISEAAGGSGEAKDALRELGLNAERLERLSLDEQFEAVADAIFRVKGQSDKTRLAMRLFDSEGVALLQTMTEGATGIRQLRQEARDLGKTLSTEQAEGAAKAKDAMVRLQASTESLARNLTIMLAPALERAATFWNEFLFPSELQQLQQRFAEITAEIRNIESASGSVFGGFLGSSGLQTSEKRLQVLREELGRVYNEILRLSDSSATIEITEIDVSTAVEHATSKIDKLYEGLRKKRAEDLKRLFDSYVSSYETAEQEVARKMREFDLVAHMFPADEQERIRKAIRHTLFEGIEEIELSFKRLNRDEIHKLVRNVEEVDKAAQELGLTMSSAFEAAILQAEGLGDIVEGLVKDLIQIFVRRSVTEPLTGFISGLFEKRHSGGPVSAGVPYIVGKPGAEELFIPDAAGMIMPGGFGGISVVNNIDARGASSELERTLPGILERNRQATIEQLYRLRDKGRF